MRLSGVGNRLGLLPRRAAGWIGIDVGTSSVKLAQVRKINREGARIAREAAGDKASIAGAIGPLGKPLEPIGSIRLEEAEAAYREQAEGLLEGGVDAFVIETMPSLDQARAALAAVRADPQLAPVQTIKTLRWKRPENQRRAGPPPRWFSWIVGLFAWLGESTREIGRAHV